MDSRLLFLLMLLQDSVTLDSEGGHILKAWTISYLLHLVREMCTVHLAVGVFQVVSRLVTASRVTNKIS